MQTNNHHTAWQPDILGAGFEMRHVEQQRDYSGRVRCTLIRRRANDEASPRGVLYIHGFSDYFFQREMGERFAAQGYHFYAVDLRKYGRSLLPGQKMYQVRDLTEYFADLRAGLSAMEADGISAVTLMGHSTGGLVAALFMTRYAVAAIDSLILNSPFLEWNLPRVVVRLGVPALRLLAACWPTFPIKLSGGQEYARSLARGLDGEWDYNRTWKPDRMPPIDAAWVRAIDRGHRALRRAAPLSVPVLLLHSDKSAYPGDAPELFSRADGILNATAIAAAGRRLGPRVTDATVADAMHDVVLSRREVREQAYARMFEWLDRVKHVTR